MTGILKITGNLNKDMRRGEHLVNTKTVTCKPRRKASEEIKSADTLISGF